MFKTNEYFDGKVKVHRFHHTGGARTVGVMAPGAYEFGTSSVEYMTVISGGLNVQLPGKTEWHNYEPFETFIVPKDSKFKLEVKTDTAYLCLYK